MSVLFIGAHSGFGQLHDCLVARACIVPVLLQHDLSNCANINLS